MVEYLRAPGCCPILVLPPDLKKAKISQKSEEKSKTILPDSKDDPLVD